MQIKELYLDTTYVMPFLFLDIDVKDFSRSRYKDILKSLDRVHISEVSLIEAKAKSMKINSTRNNISNKFNEGLSILLSDEKVVIHRYNAIDDSKFNDLDNFNLDFFDRIILAQAMAVGCFLTEDGKLLKIKNAGIKILNWNYLIKEINK